MQATTLLTPLYKLHAERLSQCAKSDFVHCGPRSGGTLYTALLDQAGFVHWRPRLDGGLYTGTAWHCTNPLPNNLSSAQSPSRRFRAVCKPPRKQPLQCAKPDFVHCSPRSGGGLHTSCNSLILNYRHLVCIDSAETGKLAKDSTIPCPFVVCRRTTSISVHPHRQHHTTSCTLPKQAVCQPYRVPAAAQYASHASTSEEA